ncbi:MAG: DUF6325 family protein [Propionicimonas sp.]|uniref:DUF6325 family protein n=1 Tax=Propionicimonas sp. TaxID=1955623 RepID=UPI002B2045F8|nr:DUF6325 family protein [Propionicimonas sp.]MEA4942832.1 DUF6325 family protein [Propionicimonas sp.]MEA5052443.1 DUF6325 family protein [Propionicimonas sp.]MEA5118574.1 DUF6325 family protein [Propionicimonas sp.]
MPIEHLGPVEIIALELPTAMSPEPWHHLHAAVDAGLLRLLDLEFLHRVGEDEAEVLDAADLPEALGVTLPGFDGCATGLLSDTDIIGLLAEVEVGAVIAVVFVEHLSMLPVIAAFETYGSRALVEGPVDADDLARRIDDSAEPPAAGV